MPEAGVILVVDDDPAALYAASRTLARAGFDVVEASSGAEALELAPTCGCDLVVLDVNLGDTTGFAVARTLVTAGLVGARTRQEIAGVVIAGGLEAIGADAGAVHLLDEGGARLDLAAARGWPDELAEQWRRFPVAADLPAAEAFRSRLPLSRVGRGCRLRPSARERSRGDSLGLLGTRTARRGRAAARRARSQLHVSADVLSRGARAHRDDCSPGGAGARARRRLRAGARAVGPARHAPGDGARRPGVRRSRPALRPAQRRARRDERSPGRGAPRPPAPGVPARPARRQLSAEVRAGGAGRAGARLRGRRRDAERAGRDAQLAGELVPRAQRGRSDPRCRPRRRRVDGGEAGGANAAGAGRGRSRRPSDRRRARAGPASTGRRRRRNPSPRRRADHPPVEPGSGLDHRDSPRGRTRPSDRRHPHRLGDVAVAGAARRSRRQLTGRAGQQLPDLAAEQSERLSSIVDDVLLASELDNGARRLRSEPIDVRALAERIVAARAASLPSDIRIELRARRHVLADGDGERLEHVLANLLDIAIKYSPDGGVIVVAIAGGARCVRLTISDEGLGIPAGELDRIFEKLYRADPQQRRGVGGTGLGLYIARELVHQMDGSISVESTPGRGSRFTVEVPRAGRRTSERSVPPEPVQSRAAGPPGPPLGP